MLRKLRGLVVALGVTISLSAASAPTDAAAYTCGSCGHRCDDGDYGGRYGGNHYSRRFDDCGCGRDYRGYGHDYDGYGGVMATEATPAITVDHASPRRAGAIIDATDGGLPRTAESAHNPSAS